MKKFFHETRLILLFFIILTATTVFSFFDSAPEKTKSPSPQEMLSQTADSIEIKRRPSAVDPDPTPQVMSVDIFCEKKNPARFHKTSQNLVMLNLHLCEEIKSDRHLWIKNETNGFKAQIFKTKTKNFRTDFIQMNVGTNKFLIESVLKDGQKRVQSLEIISGS